MNKTQRRRLQELKRIENTYRNTDEEIRLYTIAVGPSYVFYRSYEWKQLRYRVLKELGNICFLCGASPHTGARIDVDHIKPRSIYPEFAFTFSNLQILCGTCNEGKSNKDTTDWSKPKTILRKTNSSISSESHTNKSKSISILYR